MKFYIRRATVEDAEAIAIVEIVTWHTAYQGLIPDTFLKHLSESEKTKTWRQNLLKHELSGHKQVLVAVGDEGIIGFTRVGAVEVNVGLVYLLYVLPEYWGCGVGTRLMSAAMDKMRDLRLTEAILWVLRDNTHARQFYEKLGWTFSGRTTSQSYGGVELEALCYQRAVNS